LNYLINGSSSIVGYNIAKYIIKKKNYIYCLFNKIKPINLKSKYSFLQKNNFKRMFKVKKKIDCIIFCAIDKTNNYNNLNLKFLKQVCEFSKSENVKKLIFISTMAVYGSPRINVVHENYKGHKVSMYGKIKLKQEKILFDFSKKNCDCQITILRLPGVVGKKKTGIFLSKVLAKLKKNEELIYQNPKAKFNNLIYEKDLAKIIYKVSKNKKKYNFEIFNLGSSKPMLLRKIIHKMVKKTKFNNNIIEKKPKGKSFIININKFEKQYFKLNKTSTSLNKYLKH
tara:strand:- start:373 stop:1221 length:849 start_codon:yes stop_codon:yes gene_type:complete